MVRYLPLVSCVMQIFAFFHQCNYFLIAEQDEKTCTSTGTEGSCTQYYAAVFFENIASEAMKPVFTSEDIKLNSW